MRLLLAVAAFCLLGCLPAAARVPPQCTHLGRVACGCTASVIAFGRPVEGLNAVRSWYRFPRTSAHVGAAAIWPGRHVEIVTAVHGDGTVSTTGSVGFARVPVSRLAFVEPSGSPQREHRRYEDAPRTRYASHRRHRGEIRVAMVEFDGGGSWR